VSDQRHRITALHSIIGTLYRCHVFGSENRDALVQNASAYASRLLKRADQCRAVCACSHLSWQVRPVRPNARPVVPARPICCPQPLLRRPL
jgi:vacuolar protein sorting-associated protein 35